MIALIFPGTTHEKPTRSKRSDVKGPGNTKKNTEKKKKRKKKKKKTRKENLRTTILRNKQNKFKAQDRTLGLKKVFCNWKEKQSRASWETPHFWGWTTAGTLETTSILWEATAQGQEPWFTRATWKDPKLHNQGTQSPLGKPGENQRPHQLSEKWEWKWKLDLKTKRLSQQVERSWSRIVLCRYSSTD